MRQVCAWFATTFKCFSPATPTQKSAAFRVPGPVSCGRYLRFSHCGSGGVGAGVGGVGAGVGPFAVDVFCHPCMPLTTTPRNKAGSFKGRGRLPSLFSRSCAAMARSAAAKTFLLDFSAAARFSAARCAARASAARLRRAFALAFSAISLDPRSNRAASAAGIGVVVLSRFLSSSEHFFAPHGYFGHPFGHVDGSGTKMQPCGSAGQRTAGQRTCWWRLDTHAMKASGHDDSPTSHSK